MKKNLTVYRGLKDIWASQVDRRYVGEGYWGRGTYYAIDKSTAEDYAKGITQDLERWSFVVEYEFSGDVKELSSGELYKAASKKMRNNDFGPLDLPKLYPKEDCFLLLQEVGDSAPEGGEQLLITGKAKVSLKPIQFWVYTAEDQDADKLAKLLKVKHEYKEFGPFKVSDAEKVEKALKETFHYETAASIVSAVKEDSDSFLPDRLVMVDCEMTGVDETQHDLLQAAFVKLELQGIEYVEVGEPLVLYFKHDGQPSCEFHHKFLTHIFKLCNESDLTGEQGAEQLKEWMGDWYGEVMPTGDCVPTDIAFLKHNNVVKRNNIVDDEQVNGHFHYEFWEMNPLKDLSRQIKGEKYAVSGLDEEGIHDALVDCRNQTKELNAAIAIILGQPIQAAVTSGKFKELATQALEPALSFAEAKEVPWPEAYKHYAEIEHKVLNGDRELPTDWNPESEEDPTFGAARNRQDFEAFDWKFTSEFPLEELSIEGRPLTAPVWTEGKSEPETDWSDEVFEEIKDMPYEDMDESQQAMWDQWADEVHLRRHYQGLTSEPPPIFVIWDDKQNRFRFWNGRHRARAQVLKGIPSIPAFVGSPLSSDSVPVLAFLEEPSFLVEPIEASEYAEAVVEKIQLEPWDKVKDEIERENLMHDKTISGVWINWFNPGSRAKPPLEIATAREANGNLVGWAGVGLYTKAPKGKNKPRTRGDINFFVAPGERGAGVAKKLGALALESFKKANPETDEVFYHEEYPAGEDLIDDADLFPVNYSERQAEEIHVAASVKAPTKSRRIQADGPVELPPEVQPAVQDDGILSPEKKSIVVNFLKAALRADSFQDFQILLSEVLLEAQLTEDYRPSVAGLLNEYRVAQGYVAL